MLSVTESVAGDLLVFHCDVPKSAQYSSHDVLQKVKRSIANGLCDIIIDEYEKVLVERLLQDQYGYLSEKDRELIKRKVMMKLVGRSDDKSSPSLTQRKSRIWAKLVEYLEKENDLVLEGFITFRLKEYLEELFDVVDSTVEDYLVEREYKEFLKLLRHIMEKQSSHAGELNIVRRNDDYVVLDSDKKPLSGDMGNFLEKGVHNLDLGKDDLIVSVVVTLSPERVFWHGRQDKSPCYDLLKDLLGDRLTVCTGCNLEIGEEPGPKAH